MSDLAQEKLTVAAELVEAVAKAEQRRDYEDSLHAVHRLAQTVASTTRTLVIGARCQGMSWERIAEQLGTSRQAAWERFGRDSHTASVSHGQ